MKQSLGTHSQIILNTLCVYCVRPRTCTFGKEEQAVVIVVVVVFDEETVKGMNIK